MNKSFLHIIFYLLLSLSGFGQDYLFNTRYVGVEDGLLGRRVNVILQDDEGFMWIATNEGLNRFDGYQFEHFTKESHGLNSNRIRVMQMDKEGDIWIDFVADEYIDLGIQILRPSERRILSLQEKLGKNYQEEYAALTLDNHQAPRPINLRYRFRKQFFTYDDEKQSIRKLSYQPEFYNLHNDKVWSIQEDPLTFLEYNPEGRIINKVILEEYKVEKGGANAAAISENYWCSRVIREGKFGVLLHHYQKDDLHFFPSDQPSNITVRSHGFYVKDSVYFDYKGQLVPFYWKDVLDKPSTTFLADHLNNFWMGTGDGLYILSVKKKVFTTYFKNAGVNEKFYDSRGLWADTNYLYSFSPSGSYRWNFQKQQQKKILPDSRSFAVHSTDDGYLWIGSRRKILVKYDVEKDTITQLWNQEKNTTIWSLFVDHNQRLWMGHQRNGLSYYDPLLMKNAAPFTQWNGFEAIKEGQVLHIVEDQRNKDYLWLSCQSGWYLLHIREGLKARFWSGANSDFNIPSSNIYYTHQDEEGVFWLGTAFSGLLKVKLKTDYTVESVEQFTTEDGLTSYTVYSVLEDENDQLWMSTNNGINRFHKKAEDFKAYLQEDGLPHYEFNRISSFQRADGMIFFGTLNGIVSFHPNDLDLSYVYDVPLKISRCEKYSEQAEQLVDITTEVLDQQKIIVAPNERFLTLYVALQDYYDAPNVEYAYRIKGLQENFTFTNKNEITLSGLPYGKYTLEIKAKGKDGRFSQHQIMMPLKVKKPFYLRQEFIILSILFTILAIWQLFAFRLKLLRKRQKELEEIVKSRTAQLHQQAAQLELDKNTITQQARELQSLDEMKSRFFANISHELRTPLTLILSPINRLLKAERPTEKEAAQLQLIQNNAKHLLTRVNEILDLTKLDAQQMTLQETPTAFYELTQRLAANFESAVQLKSQKLLFDYQLEKDLKIQLDQSKFAHVFNNYLSNAIKYTPELGTIHIQLYKKQTCLVLAVKDDGIGIQEKDLPHVFKRFYQADHSENKAGGSGIGLALSKEIAQVMNAKIRVTSEWKKGSTFFFEFPYKKAKEEVIPIEIVEENSISLAPLLPKTAQNEDRPKILVVEDNPQLRDYLYFILSEHYQVETAKNGAEGLKKLSEDHYQLITSDVMMPVMDGFEFLSTLKASDAYRHLPIIMLTARSEMKDKLKALRIGVDDYLHKPFLEEELLARIENLLQNVQNRRAIYEAVQTEKNDALVVEEKPSISQADLAWLQEIEAFLQKEIANPNFKIEELAHHFYVSARNLQRRMKKITGLSPNKYFREIKLQAAREALEMGEFKTVQEVAYHVGFDTAHYFSKIYKERFGKLPSDYS